MRTAVELRIHVANEASFAAAKLCGILAEAAGTRLVGSKTVQAGQNLSYGFPPPLSRSIISRSLLSCISMVNPGILVSPRPPGIPVSGSATTLP